LGAHVTRRFVLINSPRATAVEEEMQMSEHTGKAAEVIDAGEVIQLQRAADALHPPLEPICLLCLPAQNACSEAHHQNFGDAGVLL